MNVYPDKMVHAANHLQKSDEFKLLMNFRLNELIDDVLESSEQSDILTAHGEHAALRSFAEWIQHVGTGNS